MRRWFRRLRGYRGSSPAAEVGPPHSRHLHASYFDNGSPGVEIRPVVYGERGLDSLPVSPPVGLDYPMDAAHPPADFDG